MSFCLQYYLFHVLAGGLFHFKKVSHQVMSFAFSAVSIGLIKWLYYSSFLLLRRWKEHLLPRKPLATSSAKALQSAAPFATGYRCDGAVQSSGPSRNKSANLPAYTLPLLRTCSGSAANVPQQPRGRSGREHWSVDTSVYSRKIQAETGRYSHIQADMSLMISSSRACSLGGRTRNHAKSRLKAHPQIHSSEISPGPLRGSGRAYACYKWLHPTHSNFAWEQTHDYACEKWLHLPCSDFAWERTHATNDEGTASTNNIEIRY